MPKKSHARKPHALRVLAAVLEKDGRWLIAKRKKGDRFAGLWEFPGGKLEQGEVPEACLVRELSEELGIRVRVGARLGTVRYSSSDFAIELTAYRASILGGSLQLQDHEEIRWVTPSEIGRFGLTEPDRLLLRKLMTEEVPERK
jgi:mutator protein MutT